MKLDKLGYAVVALAMLAGCSDNDPDPVDNPDGPQGSGEMTEMSPEESKEFLTATSTEFLNLFNPSDQSEAIEVAAYFQKVYGDFDMPQQFRDLEEVRYASPAKYFRAIHRAASGDVDALTRAAYTYTYHINFDRFAGKYEPVSSREEWVKTGDSKDIIFVFTDGNNRQCELKASKGAGTSDFDYSYTDEGDGYYDDETYNYYLSIPKEIKVTLTVGGKVLADSKVVSDINVNGHSLRMETTATLCNLTVNAAVNGTDIKVQANMEAYVSGKKALSSYATVNGHDLCNKNKIEDLIDRDDADYMLSSMLTDGECGGDVLGKVQVYGQMKYYKGMVDDLDNYWGSYNYGSKNEAKIACEQVCDKLNANVKTQMRYNGTATDQATLVFVPYLYDWSYDWEYALEANLLFPDGTTYSVDSYFDKFTTVTNKWEALIDAYDRAWSNALPRR
ncbi:MAG: hypothetical protein K2H47_03005 [Muribaculaceae bacterium]|nr:hypothetical protein [Muribaculaceae bacterium]